MTTLTCGTVSLPPVPRLVTQWKTRYPIPCRVLTGTNRLVLATLAPIPWSDRMALTALLARTYLVSYRFPAKRPPQLPAALALFWFGASAF